MLYYLLSAVLLLSSVQLQTYEGDTCTLKTGEQGVCQNMKSCASALLSIQKYKLFPPICSFKQTEPVVCCEIPGAAKVTPAPAPTTTPPTTTTRRQVPIVNNPVEETGDGCEALPPNMTPAKTNSKSWNKCIEYQQKYVYPCERTEALAGDDGRKNKCYHNANDLIVGGVDAAEAEFPHMALLGFGNESISDVQWLCAGSIISEKFILTAGHCTWASRIGPVRYAKIGILKRTDPDENKIYTIKQIIKHPQYNSPHRYHDIALLEMETEMALSDQIVPACLDVGTPNDYTRALASGWGATLNRGSNANNLQKVILNQFSNPECSAMFPPHRLMKQGFDVKTQICYGDKEKSKDTCQGDSGGPLQLKSKEIDCMYVLVGVTSFGRACGVKGEPGIYSRVAHYLPWIEQHVWK